MDPASQQSKFLIGAGGGEVQGPLWGFDGIRAQVLDDVNQRTYAHFSSSQLDFVLSEANYLESSRIRKLQKHPLQNLLIRGRVQKDRRVWSEVHRALAKPAGEVDLHKVLNGVIGHYTQEIGGHFDPRVYRLSTQLVPLGFNWLLNAASVKTFLPWKMKELLHSKIQITGEGDQLHALAKKGTILLVPTHQSNLDSILIGYVIYLMGLPPFCYGAGLNLFTNPVLSFFMSHLGAYTVDRQKSSDIYKQALKNYSTTILKQGIHSIFFPGGGRSRSGAVEKHLKLGLLGTALQAQIENYRSGKPNPSIYVVPMVMSYHFVLEAASLIDEYLEQMGKHRFFASDEGEPWFFDKLLKFLWNLFSAPSTVTVRVGKAMDVFGNFVDQEGRSVGSHGLEIDPRRWLMSEGVLKEVPQRDREYTIELGNKIVERFHRENTVLTSHLVAFAYFRLLRRQYPDLDLYRFLRISLSQRSLSAERFLAEAEASLLLVQQAEREGKLVLCEELRLAQDVRPWVEDGVKKLGMFHGNAIVRMEGGIVWTEDMNLLYYYRNRLTGYGFPGFQGGPQAGFGEKDEKDFLV